MTTPSNTSEQLVAALAAEGVEYVFGIPGDENLHFMEALRKDGRIKFILFRHEQAAGFAAAAYGRLTGKLAVAMSTLGAGAMNLTTPVAHAYLAAMPMLVITGQKAVRDNRLGPRPSRGRRSDDSPWSLDDESTKCHPEWLGPVHDCSTQYGAVRR